METVTIFYASPNCRRNRTLKNMLKSKNIDFRFERMRGKIKGKKYPIIKTKSGKIWDYEESTIIIVKEEWGKLV
jgi:hypothetical protein